jgi:hypothetical protein
MDSHIRQKPWWKLNTAKNAEKQSPGTRKPKNVHTAVECSKYNKSQKHRVEKAKGLPRAERLFQISAFSFLKNSLEEPSLQNPAILTN